MHACMLSRVMSLYPLVSWYSLHMWERRRDRIAPLATRGGAAFESLWAAVSWPGHQVCTQHVCFNY